MSIRRHCRGCSDGRSATLASVSATRSSVSARSGSPTRAKFVPTVKSPRIGGRPVVKQDRAGQVGLRLATRCTDRPAPRVLAARMLGIGRLPGGQPIQDLPPRSRTARAFQACASTAQTPGGARPATKRPRGAAPGCRRHRLYGADSRWSTAGDEAPSRSSSGAPPPSAGTRQTSVTIGVGAEGSGMAYRIVESSSHSA